MPVANKPILQFVNMHCRTGLGAPAACLRAMVVVWRPAALPGSASVPACSVPAPAAGFRSTMENETGVRLISKERTRSLVRVYIPIVSG